MKRPYSLKFHIWRNLATGFLKFDISPKIHMILPIMTCEAEIFLNYINNYNNLH